MNIQFNIKFITPLLIGGADSKRMEENGLTGKALRGCWRFWFRAIIGGIFDGLSEDYLKQLLPVFEECVFGSTGKATFRMLVEPVCMQTNGYLVLPHNNRVNKKGYSPGSTFCITVIPRKNAVADGEMKALFSSIWLWANLGAVGNRERRGFGSPVICPITTSASLFSEAGLPVYDKNAFDKAFDLQEHLKTGIKASWNNIRNWLVSERLAKTIYTRYPEPDPINTAFNTWKDSTGTTSVIPDIARNRKPVNAAFFILKSLEQVAVSSTTYPLLYLPATDANPAGPKGAIASVHGTSACNELGWAKKPSPGYPQRWASPVFIRFHKIRENGREVFCPVMTWCQQNGIPASTPSCAQIFLKRRIGFNNSLAGPAI